MTYQKGDLVRLREGPILPDLRVGSALWCTVEIAGHEFSGYVPERDVYRVAGPATIDLYGPPRYARSTTDGRRA